MDLKKILLLSFMFFSLSCANLRIKPQKSLSEINPSSLKFQSYSYYLKSRIQDFKFQGDQSLNSLNKALSLKPEDKGLRLQLALKFLSLKKFDQAKKEVQYLLKKDPKYLKALRLDAEIDYIEGKFNKALQKALKLRNRKSSDSKTYSLISMIYSSLKKHHLALKYIQKSLQLSQTKKQKASLYYQKALIYADLKQKGKAKYFFEKSIKANPAAVDSAIAYIQYLSSIKQTKKALAFIEKNLDSFLDNLIISSFLMETYVEQKDYKKALYHAENLSGFFPESKELLYKKLALFLELKKFDEGISEIKRSLRKSRKDQKLQSYLFHFYKLSKDYKKALRHLSKVHPKGSIEFYLEKSRILALSGEANEAISLVEKHVLSTYDKRVLSFYLSLLEAERLYEKAIYFLENLSVMFPGQFSFDFQLGSFYYEIRDLKKSIFHLNLALEKQKNDPYVLNYLAYIYAELGIHLKTALHYSKKALKQKPKNAYMIDTLAWVYYKSKNYKKAVYYSEKAYVLSPEDLEISLHLNYAYLKAGKFKKAKKFFQVTESLFHQSKAFVKEKFRKQIIYLKNRFESRSLASEEY